MLKNLNYQKKKIQKQTKNCMYLLFIFTKIKIWQKCQHIKYNNNDINIFNWQILFISITPFLPCVGIINGDTDGISVGLSVGDTDVGIFVGIFVGDTEGIDVHFSEK